jgi:Maltokinase N-terminal cap domain
VARVQPGPTLTPHFREFLPPWVAGQPWYPGTGIPGLRPVGSFRYEDPAGEVGIETHLLTDGSVVYQLPMTYRGAPLPGLQDALITTAEHSVLGTRWIYDAVADPVWIHEVLRLVQTEGVSEPASTSGIRSAQVRGHLRAKSDPSASTATIELNRVITADALADDEPDVLGVVTGTWEGLDGEQVGGCLVVVRAR